MHTTQNVRNKQEKLEGKDEDSFDTPLMAVLSHAESLKKSVGGLWDLPAKQLSQSSPIWVKMAWICCAIQKANSKGLPQFSPFFQYDFVLDLLFSINGMSKLPSLLRFHFSSHIGRFKWCKGFLFIHKNRFGLEIWNSYRSREHEAEILCNFLDLNSEIYIKFITYMF